MRKGTHFSRLLGLLLAAMLVCCVTVPALAASTQAKSTVQTIKAEVKGTVTQKTALYSSAKTSSKVLKYLVKGTRISLIGTSGSMYKVRMANGNTAYVLAKYVKVETSTQRAVKSTPVALTISAAASLTDALNEIQKLYKADKPNVTLTINYGSSGSLEQQIEQGAPVDVFISAASKQMDDLEKKNLLLQGTNKVLLKNHLVLIAPKGSDKVKGFDSLASSEVKVIACGDPSSVPAGKYAQETLTKLELWDKVQSKLVLGKDVRQVLTYVESGNADAGLVYTTDALTSNQVQVVATADEKSHSPIVYPAAVIKDSKHPAAAKDFIAYLSGAKARAVFEKYGFVLGE